MEYMARCNNAQRRQVMIPPRATRLPDAVSDLSLNHELIEARAREEAEKERKAAGKLKPIDPSSKLRDHKDNEFFGTSFSNFGRIRRRKEQARKEAAARRAKLLANKASKAKKAEEERVNSVLAKNYKATTCTPSTNVQKNQVRHARRAICLCYVVHGCVCVCACCTVPVCHCPHCPCFVWLPAPGSATVDSNRRPVRQHRHFSRGGHIFLQGLPTKPRQARGVAQHYTARRNRATRDSRKGQRSSIRGCGRCAFAAVRVHQPVAARSCGRRPTGLFCIWALGFVYCKCCSCVRSVEDTHGRFYLSE